MVAFDEAYFEYVDAPPDTLKFIRDRRNVIVLRTFSKIQGLASLRIGYGMAHPELIQVLQKTRQPFNVNGLAQDCGRRRVEPTTSTCAKPSESRMKVALICKRNSRP